MLAAGIFDLVSDCVARTLLPAKPRAWQRCYHKVVSRAAFRQRALRLMTKTFVPETGISECLSAQALHRQRPRRTPRIPFVGSDLAALQADSSLVGPADNGPGRTSGVNEKKETNSTLPAGGCHILAVSSRRRSRHATLYLPRSVNRTSRISRSICSC